MHKLFGTIRFGLNFWYALEINICLWVFGLTKSSRIILAIILRILFTKPYQKSPPSKTQNVIKRPIKKGADDRW
jgi:hypothetical protein